jgi:hypothetical protein
VHSKDERNIAHKSKIFAKNFFKGRGGITSLGGYFAKTSMHVGPELIWNPHGYWAVARCRVIGEVRERCFGEVLNKVGVVCVPRSVWSRDGTRAKSRGVPGRWGRAEPKIFSGAHV